MDGVGTHRSSTLRHFSLNLRKKVVGVQALRAAPGCDLSYLLAHEVSDGTELTLDIGTNERPYSTLRDTYPLFVVTAPKINQLRLLTPKR